jgi:hypothetical protein
MTSAAMTSDPEESRWFRSAAETLKLIRRYYEDESEERIVSQKWEREIQSWHQWFETTYPGVDANEDRRLVEKNKGKMDFRLFLHAYSIEAFALIRVLDACYAVDTALCGLSLSTSEQIKKLQSMHVLEYLNSEELISWWEVSLCELDELIKSRESVSLSDNFRVSDIQNANHRLQEHVGNLYDNCWVNLREDLALHDAFFRGFEDLESRIEKRAERLNAATNFLDRSLKAAKIRADAGGRTKTTETSAFQRRSSHDIDEGDH